MTIKKVIIVTLSLCLLIIGAVSAASNSDDTISDVTNEKITHNNDKISTNSITSTDNIKKNNVDKDILESSGKEILSESDDGTFTALQNKINNAPAGSTIKLKNNYYYDTGFNKNGINISKSITINGNGKTINAKNKTRIFYIPPNIHLTIKNLKIINANTNNGGAIYNNGTLTIINTKINNNKTTKTFKETINHYKDNLTIKNTKINKNQKNKKNTKIINYKFNAKNIKYYSDKIDLNKYKIKKAPSQISVKSIKTYPQTKVTQYAQVYNKKNNTPLNEGYVKFKIKGKTYKAKVKNGQAKIKIKTPQKPGTYTCKAKYYGGKHSKNSKTIKFKIIVKKK